MGRAQTQTAERADQPMTDTTVNQSATPNPDGDKPDVDQLFAQPDVDELFPANYKPSEPPTRNISPLHDLLFSHPGRAQTHILDAFGYGFSEAWGEGNKEATRNLNEADEWMRKAGVYNDYAAGQRNIIRSANEVIMRPAVAAIAASVPFVKSILGGTFQGGQEAVKQTGVEYGFPGVARELAAIPEAFPTGVHGAVGVPHVPELITRAKSLDTIGAGEEGYFGTKPVEPTSPVESAPAAKAEVKPEALAGTDAEAAPSPAAQPQPAPPEPTPDIHAVAREIAPQAFQEFDALAQKKDTFRRWIGELRDARDQDAQANAPHADEIAKLDAQIAEIQQAKKGGFGKLRSLTDKRDALTAERDTYIAEHTQGDSADMAKVRQQLMETDYRMRDLAGDVSKAYREAEGRMPQQEVVAAHETEPAEIAPAEVQTTGAAPAEPIAADRAAPTAEAVAPAQAAPFESEALANAAKKADEFAGKQATKPETAEPARLPIAHAPSIVADVTDRLVKAGRPAEEAEAAAQVVAAYWETRAARFEGKKGTAAEMYAREAPEIVAGKEKPQKAATKITAKEYAQTPRTQLPPDIQELSRTLVQRFDRLTGTRDRLSDVANEVSQTIERIGEITDHLYEVSDDLDSFVGSLQTFAEHPTKDISLFELAGQAGHLMREARRPNRFKISLPARNPDLPELDLTPAQLAEIEVLERRLQALYPQVEHLAETYRAGARELLKGVHDLGDEVSRSPHISEDQYDRIVDHIPDAEAATPLKTLETKLRGFAGEADFYQSQTDRGGRAVPVTEVDPNTPLTVVELNDRPLRTRAEAIDDLKSIAGNYKTQSGQQVTLNARKARKAFSGAPNEIKRSLAAQLGNIIEHSVIYGKAGDFDYAVAHLRLDGQDVAVRLALKEVDETGPKLYQFEGLSIESKNPDASAGVHEQTIATHSPERAQSLSGLPAQSMTVGDLVSVFNRNAGAEFPLFQGVKGRIRVRDDARNTITLMKSADASTFIHETGHDWLDRMMKDARDPDAPAILKQDSDTVLKWLGADSPEAIKTKHHEKFARGFETYMMEGRAPSTALARVFAKFKDWLTTIYKTVAALKAPISDDIRAVFDRLLAERPERTVIAPEREAGPSLAEKHEGLAEQTAPERAFTTANEIRSERDSNASTNQLEENDVRLGNARTGAEEYPPGNPQSAGAADAARTISREAPTAGGAGALGEGGGEAPLEGNSASESAGRKGASGVNRAPTPLLNFLAGQGGIKASDALISDLRQSLGGKNRYIPGFGQLIRTHKQLSSAAKAAGRLEAMSLDRAREAAIEQGLLPHDATIRDLLDAIDNEARGIGAEVARAEDPAAQAHAEHAFVETVNDALKEAGGFELTDHERARALELRREEGLNDPHAIIERLALEADDAEPGAVERVQGIPGWDVPAPGWDTLSDDGRPAPGESGAAAAGQSIQSGGAAARGRGEAENLHPLDPNAPLPPSETRLIDKAGNIRLDNLGTPEDVNAVIRATADELSPYNEAITRGVIPDAEVIKLADALGMDASKLSERKLGQAFNAEQIVAARKLLIQSAQNVRDAMAKAAAGAEADILAYAQAKSRHLMIQEQVHGITAEAGRALRAFRALEGQQEAAAISTFLQDTTGKTLYQLQREAQLGLQLETPQQVSKFVHDTAQPTWKDRIIEAWMACLLSGPRTHVANILGNSISSLWRPIETATSAVVGKVLGSEDAVQFHEATAEMFGMVQGAQEGLIAAKKAFLTEEPQLTATLQAEKPHQHAIGGKAGQIVRTPMRLLGAEDEFFKAVAFRGDIYRQAYTIAAKEGLSAELRNQRVAELVMSPTAEMAEAAKKVADYQTFQTSLGKVGRSIQAFSNSHPLAKVVVPFVRTPLNLLKYAGERSPLGVLSQEVRDNLSGKNGARARDTQIARIALGTMVGVTAFGMASQGLLTGGGPADKGKKALMQTDGWQPYSIKIGGMYYSYNRLDPFSVTLGVAADAYEIMNAAGADHPDKEHLLSLTFAAITKNVLNRTALQGISDLNQAASDPDRYFKTYVKGLVGSFVPAISAQTAQTIDPTVRDARGIIDNLRARTPFLSTTLMPKRDVWGEPVVREGALGPDIASPIAEARLKNDPVNRALLDAGYYPSTLERKIRGVDLTDQQYDDYARLAGRMSKMRLNAFVNTPGFATIPKQMRADKMREVINAARESARSIVLMQNPDIIQKANEAKTAKFKAPATVH
jgi:hypothetical protein